MTDEQIENAEQEYVRNNHTVNPYNIIATRESFKDGIIFALTHQWISVDERLPEDDRLVLAHFSDVEPNLCYATAYYRKGVWNVPDDWYYDCRIDFWMPIPIPQLNPEKEER